MNNLETPEKSGLLQILGNATNPDLIGKKLTQELVTELKPTYSMTWKNFLRIVRNHFEEQFNLDMIRFDIFQGELEEEFEMNGEELTLFIHYSAYIDTKHEWDIDRKRNIPVYTCYSFHFSLMELYDEDGFKMKFQVEDFKEKALTLTDEIDRVFRR